MGQVRRNNDMADLAARPARESLLEIASLSSLTFTVGFLGVWVASGTDLSSLWNVTVGAGAAVLAELSWVFSVYVPTLLGFYVLVTGEQLGQGDRAGRLRRLLGGIAELSFAALLPGLVLVLLYCVSDPANIGALYVVFPATFILGFLTVELGAFVVFDASVRFAEAIRMQEQSITRLHALRRRSRRPLLLVMLTTMAMLTLLGVLTLSATGHWGWLLQWPAYLVIGPWSLVASVWGLLVALARTKPGRFNRIVAIFGVGLLWAVLISMGLSLGSLLSWPIIASAVAVAGSATLSALWPTRWGPQFAVDWCFAGMAATIAARSAVRVYRQSSRQIAELQPTMASEEEVSLRRRLDSVRTLVLRRLSTSNNARERRTDA